MLPSASDYPLIPDCSRGRVWPAKTSNWAALRAFRSALEAVGEDSQAFGLHSGRVGAQTALCEAGLPLEDLIWKGRFARNSTMPLVYTRKAPRKTTSKKTSAALSLVADETRSRSPSPE